KLAHQPAHDDEREEHPEQQIKEIVSGVDRRESDAERDPDEELSFARELELSRRPEPRPKRPTPAARRFERSPDVRRRNAARRARSDGHDLPGLTRLPYRRTRFGRRRLPSIRHDWLTEERGRARQCPARRPRTRRATERTHRRASRGERDGREPARR